MQGAQRNEDLCFSPLLAAQRQSISQRKEVTEAPLVSEAACGGLEDNRGWSGAPLRTKVEQEVD